MSIRLINTKNIIQKNNFKKAILNPISNNGLWTFNKIPKIDKQNLNNFANYTFNETAFNISKLYNLDKEFGDNNLKNIIEKSFDFPIKNNNLFNNIDICELYHGKSKSFKDIGVIFTKNLISEIITRPIHIITATTGDTGSALAYAFKDVSNVKIHILYPKDKISIIQKKQMTTHGSNIKCYEIEGNFDDCQKIVKKCLNDKSIKNLTSCNSVNIGRILAQIFYYFYMCKNDLNKNINISIPTGNMGNGLSCYIAKNMGLPIQDIIYSCNNTSNLKYLLNNLPLEKKTNVINKTLANAIDIQYPSNFERFEFFLNYNNTDKLNNYTINVNDEQIIYMIKYIYNNYGKIIDPHTAVATHGLIDMYNKNTKYTYQTNKNFIMSTAHPIKFKNEVNYKNLGIDLKTPNDIIKLLKKKEYINTYTDYETFCKNFK